MTDAFMLYLLLLSVFLIGMIIEIVICGSFIRPYIKKNGRSLVKGTYHGSAMLADASIADEISKKNGEYPWFLRLFWIIVFLEYLLIIGGVVAAIMWTM